MFNQCEYLHSQIQVVKFIETFIQCYQECTVEMVVAALIYIDRLLVNNESAFLTEVNAKGLLHIALTMSAKYHVDHYEKNTKFMASSWACSLGRCEC